MSLRQETHDLICVTLEEHFARDEVAAEEIAADILQMLELQGDDVLEHLEPPLGLQTWLRSHGLSLVATAEVVPPRVWDALEAEEVNQGTDEDDLEEHDAVASLQVGDYVEYHSAPGGPSHVSVMGSGYVEHILPDGIWVAPRPGQGLVFLDPTEDFIRLLRSVVQSPEQSAEAPPW